MERYQDIKKVGSGSFGAAHLVRNKLDGNLLVMKKVIMLDMKKKDRDALMLEVAWQLDFFTRFRCYVFFLVR